MNVVINSDFGFVILSCAGMCLQSLLFGVMMINVRRDIFCHQSFRKSDAFLALQDEHKKYFSLGISPLGYPDTGCGRYSDLLSYTDWARFNNSQRVHQNTIENLPIVLCTSILSGICYPRLSACLSVLWMVGRHAYLSGYNSKKGAEGRKLGAYLNYFSIISLFILTLVSGLKVLTQS